jgi:hypothetical protein
MCLDLERVAVKWKVIIQIPGLKPTEGSISDQLNPLEQGQTTGINCSFGLYNYLLAPYPSHILLDTHTM